MMEGFSLASRKKVARSICWSLVSPIELYSFSTRLLSHEVCAHVGAVDLTIRINSSLSMNPLLSLSKILKANLTRSSLLTSVN